MVRRPDVVLAVIPLVAVSGVFVERFAPLVAGRGVARATARLPLSAVGFVAALLVVVYALFRFPRRRNPQRR